MLQVHKYVCTVLYVPVSMYSKGQGCTTICPKSGKKHNSLLVETTTWGADDLAV